jgi:hypothetical protein
MLVIFPFGPADADWKLRGTARFNLPLDPPTTDCSNTAGRRIEVLHDWLGGFETPRLRLALRTRCNDGLSSDGMSSSAELRGVAELRFLGSGRLVMGEIEAEWATGCLLGDWAGFGRFRAERRPGPETFPLRLRGVSAWRMQGQRGAAALVPLGPLRIGAWAVEHHYGVGASLGALAATVARTDEGRHARWRWSLSAVWLPRATTTASATASATAGGRGNDPRQGRLDWLLLEATGGFRAQGTPPWEGLGGSWQIELAPILGRLAGCFRWHEGAAKGVPAFLPGENEGSTELGDESRWSLDWRLPPLRGLTPQVSVLACRKPSRRDPVLPIEHASRLSFAAEPWSGAALRFSVTGVQTQRCMGDPSDADRKAIVRSTCSLLDLTAKIDLARGFRLSLRYRQSRSGLLLADAETPIGLGPALDRDGGDEISPEETRGSLWWDRGMGSVTSVRVRWDDGRRWRCGGTLAATPGDSRGAAAVLVRIPPGRSYWRTLGGGRWLAEFWLGRLLMGWRAESVLRVLSAKFSAKDWRFEFLLGVERRFG